MNGNIRSRAPSGTHGSWLAAYLLKRLLLGGFTLLLITIAVYAAVRILPGEPSWGDEPQIRPHVERWLRSLHADEPIATGYSRWFRDLMRGDLGTSLGVQPGRPVAALLLEAIPWTATLGLLSFATTIFLALPIGVLGAWRPAAPAARITTGLLYILHALPAFWIALALQHLLAGRLRLLPVLGTPPGSDSGGLPPGIHWVLPTLALSLGSLAFVIRFCRSALLEASRADYARAARARGADDVRVFLGHAMANTAVPLISLVGLMLPGILAGSVMIETIFALPGIGRLFFLAAGRRDYPVMMALSLMSAAATLIATLGADILYRAADPRVALVEEDADDAPTSPAGRGAGA